MNPGFVILCLFFFACAIVGLCAWLDKPPQKPKSEDLRLPPSKAFNRPMKPLTPMQRKKFMAAQPVKPLPPKAASNKRGTITQARTIHPRYVAVPMVAVAATAASSDETLADFMEAAMIGATVVEILSDEE